MDRANLEVEIEEVRGRITGVKRDQANHERICAERYAAIDEKQGDLKCDIAGLKQSIARYMGIGFTILIGVAGWSLKSQWDAQQDTNRMMLQMLTGATHDAPPSIAIGESKSVSGARK